MLKYKFFKREDEEGINSFLQEAGERVAPDGISVFENNVAFFYSDISKEEQFKKGLTSSVRKGIAGMYSELAGIETDLRFMRSQALRGVKSADQDVVKYKNAREDKLSQIRCAEKVMEEIEAGEEFWKSGPTI